MPDRTPVTYAYIRMSKASQVGSPDDQRDTIGRTAAADGRSVDIWITDAAISGKVPLLKREGGRELDARLKKGDHVYIARLDRMFRRASDCALIIDRWQRIGVHLHVCNLMGMGIDLSSAVGRFIALILAAVAELEREFIAERTRDSLARRRRTGGACGRYAGYGWKWRKLWDPEKGRHVKTKVRNEEERAIMREIVKWRAEGHSFDEISQHLTYTLKVLTWEGKEWTLKRCQRAYVAELKLQLAEARRGDHEA
jgi:DNA invertase Pin-like site-specific DNA recombinase